MILSRCESRGGVSGALKEEVRGQSFGFEFINDIICKPASDWSAICVKITKASTFNYLQIHVVGSFFLFFVLLLFGEFINYGCYRLKQTTVKKSLEKKITAEKNISPYLPSIEATIQEKNPNKRKSPPLWKKI